MISGGGEFSLRLHDPWNGAAGWIHVLFMESPSKCPSKMDWFSALVSLDIPWPLEGVAVSKSGMLDLEEI